MPKPKSRPDRKSIEKLVFDVAEQLLASSEMPEAGIHFSRLQREGHSEEDAKRMIGTVVMTHIYFAKKTNSPFDHAQIRSELARLPKIGSLPDGRILDIRGFE